MMGIRALLLGAGLAAMAAMRTAGAAELAVQVNDAHGQPVGDAVVTVLPREPATTLPRRPAPATRTIDQKDLAFVPYLEVFRPGDVVVFHNSDHTRHHGYSFSPVKAFEFVLAAGESSTPLRLEKPGVVAVGCNIHDQMIAYLYVSGAPWIAHTGGD